MPDTAADSASATRNCSDKTLANNPPAINSACIEAFELQRKTKQTLSAEQRLLQVAQEELTETLRSIESDRQKINALQHEQTFTSRQITDALAKDVRRYETLLGYRQPDLLRYCHELLTTRDCLLAIRNIRDCKQHIQLAETLVAYKYGSLLAERATETKSNKTAASGVVTSLPVPAVSSNSSDATAAAAAASLSTTGAGSASKLRRLNLHVPSSSSSSSVISSKTISCCATVARTPASPTNSDKRYSIVQIEIRDKDAPRTTCKDQTQLPKPLAQIHSAGSGIPKPQKATKM